MARIRTLIAFAVAGSLVIAACGGSQESSGKRTRNLTRGDGYEVPRVLLYEYEDALDRTSSREWGAGYTTAGPSTWDSHTYDTGQGRARVGGPIYEEIGPRVPPRTNRPGSTPPPIYERPSSAKGSTKMGTTTPKVPSGTTMKTGNLGKLIGGLGNIGASMAGSLAMAGIGMALSALGAPPFLMSLFGGPDAQTIAMLEAIMDMLKEMDKKLDTIIEKLDAMQVSVNDIGSAVQLLSGSVCDESVTQTVRDLSAVLDPIDLQWMRVYQENKIVAGDNTDNKFTADQLDYFNTSQSEISALNPVAKIERIESLLLGDGDLSTVTGTQAGLLSQVQKCTLAKKRFLTNADTANWQSLAMLMMVSQAKAAELATWNEVYTAMKEKRSPNLTTLNRINLTIRHSMSNIGFHVSMQIPEGQFLDTVTNKMWRMAPSGTAKVGLQDALTGCLADEERFVNYAPVPSWDGNATRDLNMCVATKAEAEKSSGGLPTGSPLDRTAGVGDARGDLPAGDWRIPTAGEITNGSGKFNGTSVPGVSGLLDSGANKSGGMFYDWKNAKCGSSRSVACTTPADYLQTYGSSIIPAGLGIVWSNTTYGKVGDGGANRGVAWTLQNVWDSYNKVWNPSGTGVYGFCEDDEQMGGSSGYFCPETDDIFSTIAAWQNYTVTKIPGSNGTTVTPQQRDNFCFRATNDKTPNGHNKNEWYNPFTPEVAVFNLGVTGSNALPSRGPVTKSTKAPWVNLTPAAYKETKPGEYTSYFASRQVTEASIVCKHDWYSPVYARLPQVAQAMWVRNLGPSESYYSVTGTTGPNGVPELRSFQKTLQPATVSILSMNGQAVIHSRLPKNATGSYVVKCLVNPEVDPLTPQEVITAGVDCPVMTFSYADGPYRVYVATARTQGDKQIVSNLEIADIALSSKFAEIPGVTPSTVEPASSTEAALALSVKGSGTPAPTDGLSSTPVTSASAGVVDLGTLLKKAKFRPGRSDKVKVTVAASSRAFCRYDRPTLTGLKAGKCSVTVTLTPAKGKKKSKTFSIPISG